MNVDPRFPRPTLPPEAPFNPAQKAWLEGFIAGLMTPAAGQGPGSGAGPAKPSLTVLFASQTGNAESLAKKLAKAAKAEGYAAKAVDVEAVDLDALAGLGHVALIASTTGEAEAPDPAKPLARALDAAEGEPLREMKYAVMALGDSSYAHFCAFGRELDARFAALGATPLIERVEADTDVDAPFEAFRTSLFQALEKQAAPADGGGDLPATDSDADDDDEDEDVHDKANPFAATLIESRVLNGPGSDKETRHVALSLEGGDLRYEPGDALGVVAPNDPALVEAVLRAGAFDGDESVVFGRDEPRALRDVLAHRAAIAQLTHSTLLRFQERAESRELAAILETEGTRDVEAYLWGRDLVDLLIAHPGVVPNGQALVSMLPALAPRLYSISSSSRAHPGEVHLTVATVRYAAFERDRGGVASTHLADRLEAAGTLGVYRHRNRRFRLPDDAKTPIVMIGPGTGIAPFRAFLQERRAAGGAGPAWLFFGDRHADRDYLYREDIQSFRDDGTLTRLDTAFSRDGADKVYVQHRIAENGADLWKWISDGAHLYVCGDAKRMAKDLDDALVNVIAAHGRMSRAKAEIELQDLMAARRYLKDVY